jgi:hypothetical protein
MRSQPATEVRLLAAYAAIVLLAFGYAYLRIDRAEVRSMKVVRSGVLLYASNQPYMDGLARVAAQSDLSTVDLSSPGSGLIVRHLTGRNNALSPSLIIPIRGRAPEIITSPYAVRTEITYATQRSSPFELGKGALLWMACLLAVAISFRRELVNWSGFVPTLGLLAIGALAGHCLHCWFASSWLETWAPIFSGLYLLVAMLLFTIPGNRPINSYGAFGLLSAAIPVVQSFMLINEPKLCPACLILTFVSGSMLVAALDAAMLSIVTGIRVPISLRVLLLVALFLILVRHILNLNGYLIRIKPVETLATSVIGSPLSQYLPGESANSSVLYVVGEPLCSSCAHAKHDLTAMKIPWRYIPICGGAKSGPCFNAKGLNFMMPMLLICDRQGDIIYQNEGWDSDPKFVADIKAHMERRQ